jgi:DHA1 family bicyclomycin/chloramphenicol resistance-like MFS transporter
MDRRFLIPFCGVLLTFNAFSCDIILPAFFAIERDLGASIERVQAIIPIFLMAAGAGQLAFGPLSDRFGRRPVLLAGVALYIVGSLLALLASTLPALYFSRGLQGLGAACGVVVGRAILRDTHGGAELARAMAIATAIFAIGPLTAPLIGAGLLSVVGWRGVFAALAVFGIAVWTATLLGLRETNAAPDTQALSVARFGRAVAAVARHPQSRHWLIVAVLLHFTVIVQVVNAPRIFKSAFGYEGGAFAAAWALSALGIVAGQLISSRLIRRFGVIATVEVAASVFFADVAVIALAGFGGVLTAPFFIALLVVFTASMLVMLSNAISLFLDPHREIAGTASSIYGFVSQLLGSGLALAVMPALAAGLQPWALLQVAIGAALLALVVRFRLGEARRLSERRL